MGVVGWRGGSADLWVRAGVWFCMALRFFSSSLCLKVRSFLMNTSGKAELGSPRYVQYVNNVSRQSISDQI